MTGLTNLPFDPLLDLPPWVGQRQATFRFQLTDGVTGENLGEIHPLRLAGRATNGQFSGGSSARLSHDTSRTIKRQLNFSLGREDTAAINPVRDRVDLFMVFPGGIEYPLGRYMFTDESRQVFTSGRLGNVVLNDEMFLVDQQITRGITGGGRNCLAVISEVMSAFPFILDIAPTPFRATGSWGIGTARGSMLESLALEGDYFSPWFGNDGAMHWIRSFDPANQVPDFDLDEGNSVARDGIVETSDLLLAPNVFIVVSNAATDPSVEVVGRAEVPPSAPHSIPNRGFEVPLVLDLQLADATQASAVAQNLVNRQTIFEQVSLTTAPDPRHDSYNVIRWQGELWLELAWDMDLVEGGTMGHTMRKAYRP